MYILIFYFLIEREHARTHRGRGREGGLERESHADCVSTEADAGVDFMMLKP